MLKYLHSQTTEALIAGYSTSTRYDMTGLTNEAVIAGYHRVEDEENSRAACCSSW